MNDLEKKVIAFASKHPEYDESVALSELKYINETDSDLTANLWTLHVSLQEAGEIRTENKWNSYLAYFLKITFCKPDQRFQIKKRRTYGRSGFPDIDMDFDWLRRSEIVEYLVEKYGREYVGNIGNVQTLKTKAAVRRAIKVLDPTNSIHFDNAGKEIKGKVNENFALENEILQTLPTPMRRGDGSSVDSVDEACEEYPHFKQYMDKYPEVRRIAGELEGTIAGFGVHAAGLLLSPIPLSQIAPMHITREMGTGEDGKPKRVIATQFPMDDVERMGLIKFDILGLSTKTAVNWACKYLKEKGIDIDWNKIPLDDKETLQLLHSGRTDGCFQLENHGMKECLKMIGIDTFDDLVVAVAMYRPGPKDYIPEFAGRKRKRITVSYPHELLKEITEGTHGIICYQEDTLISMSDGSEKPIKQVRIGDKVHSVNLDTGKVEIKECYGCDKTSSGEGLLIILENGYRLLVTPDHEIFTYNGMKEAQKLEVGRDIIACPLLTLSDGTVDCIASWLGTDESVAYLLGQLTGDGNVHIGCSLSCGLKEACDSVEGWIKNYIPKLKINKYFHGSWHLGISCDELQNLDSEWNNSDVFNSDLKAQLVGMKDNVNLEHHGNRKTKFHVLLENVGLKTNCYSKSVPLQILKHKSDRVKSSYLAGLFDSDGSITKSSNGLAICHYTSVSPKLINGVRKLLQLLGISHQVRPNRIHVWDTEKLCQCIDEFLVVRSFPENLTQGKYSSRIPSSELRFLKEKDQISGREFVKKYGISRSALLPKKEFVCYGTAEKCGIFSGDLRYYHIVSIEKIPDQQFWGMSVEGHHNLIANGIVAKNCYQEQVMQAFMVLADLTASDGYAFMKGCAKKKPEIIQGYEKKFFQGAAGQGIDIDIIQNIWNDLKKFAGYSFNKSHSVSYAYESYKTAYLKAHHPTEFIAARLSVETRRRNFDDVEKYKKDASRHFGFKFEPVDLNKSKLDWTIEDNKVLRTPLLAKGVGIKAAEDIVKHQPYTGNDLLLSFGKKVGKAVNTKVIEAMKDAGFWKGIPKEKLIENFDKIKKDKKRTRGRAKMDLYA